MTENWNLQTNLKNKPNAQGTLFSGGKSQLNPQRRWPRGYTPERQKAVHEAVKVNDVSQNEWKPDTNSHRARAVMEQIKRSSAPVSDLKHLRINIMRPEHPLASATLQSANGYYIGHEEGSWPRGEINLRPEAKGPTVLHEIGHHASNLAGTEHSRYNSARKRGEEEGFADAYADRHLPNYDVWRHPANRDRFDAAEMMGRRAYEPRYQQALDTQGNHRPDHFRAGYDFVRPMESRVPNRDDLWRDDSAAFHAKQAQDEAHRRANPTLPFDNTPPVPTARGSVPPPPPRG